MRYRYFNPSSVSIISILFPAIAVPFSDIPDMFITVIDQTKIPATIAKITR